MPKAKYSKQCLQCGKKFTAATANPPIDEMKIKQARYCSETCQRRARKTRDRLQREDAARGNVLSAPKGIAGQFGRKIEAGRLVVAAGEFGPRPHQPPVPAVECARPECGKKVKWKGGRPAKFCSPRCRYKVWAETNRPAAEARPPKWIADCLRGK